MGLAKANGKIIIILQLKLEAQSWRQFKKHKAILNCHRL